MKLRLRIHPAGAALLAAGFLFADSHRVLAAMAALVWHEVAHLLLMALAGVKSCQIELTPFGGMAYVQGYDRLSPLRQAAIAAAGILASGLGAWLCLRALPGTRFVYALMKANLALLLINGLPAWPLDGARVITALAALWGWQRSCQRLLTVAGYLLGAFFVALGLYGAWHGALNPGLLALGPYLWYAAKWGVRAQRLREMGADAFSQSDLLPVQSYACPLGKQRQAMARIAGKGNTGRYPMLLVVDPASGRLTEALTQRQMNDSLFSETICGTPKK